MLHGFIHPDFPDVARVLRRILPRRGPGGAAVCVYHKGEKVVDAWGGTRDATGAPWEEDTLSISFSTAKGVASTLLHVFADRGLVDYDTPVAEYWPEFAQGGKERITVRQLMARGMDGPAEDRRRNTQRILERAARWQRRLGYHRVFAWRARVPGGFGHFGFGGPGAGPIRSASSQWASP